MDDCFRGGVRSKESAREGGALRHSSTVYCAKHLYTLDNEMCSTCAKRGWRDVRAPVRQTGNALGTGEQWLLPPLHSSSGAWLKPCPWFLGDMVRLAPRPHRSFRRPLRRRLFHASAHAPAAAGRAPVDAPSSCTRPLFSPHPLDPTRCHPHRRRRRSPPFARRHGYCTAVVLCGRDVCAVRVYIGGQHLRKSTPFLERRILQVGVFGGSGEHIPSKGRAARGPCEFGVSLSSAVFLHFS